MIFSISLQYYQSGNLHRSFVSFTASSKITNFEEESTESSKIHSSDQSSTSKANETHPSEKIESGWCLAKSSFPYSPRNIQLLDVLSLLEIKSLSEHLSKKVEISDSNSSESGEPDSQTESNSTSNSDTT